MSPISRRQRNESHVGYWKENKVRTVIGQTERERERVLDEGTEDDHFPRFRYDQRQTIS